MASRRGRGEGSVYQRHDHPSCPKPVDGVRPEHRCKGRWIATLDLGWSGGKRRRKVAYGRTKAEVQEKLRELIRKTPTVRSDMTVSDWLTHWLTEIAPERCRPRTLSGYEGKVNGYIIPLIGKHRLDALEPRHVRDMYKTLRGRDLSESTLRQTHAILHRALKVAMREEHVTRNVAEMVEPPATKQNRREPLTLDETRRVLEACRNDPYASRWHVALRLGLRQGEALALSWGAVDLDAGTLQVYRALSNHSGRLVYTDPKSAAAHRTVPLTPQILAQLKVLRARQIAERATPPTDDDLVWPDGNGDPQHPRADWQAWTDLLAKAGVKHRPLHAARNTAARRMEEAGAAPRLVAEILGHSQVQITYRYQTGASLEERRKALTAIHGLEK